MPSMMVDDAKPRATLGAYLQEEGPFGAMWPHLNSAVFRDGPRTANLTHLSPPARHLYLSGVLQGEVGGGGLSTFFSNSSGNHVPETLDALKAIGATEIVALLQRAFEVFGGELPPRDRKTRCDVLFAFEEHDEQFLLTLDEAFTELEAELEDLRARYLERHAGAPLLAVALPAT